MNKKRPLSFRMNVPSTYSSLTEEHKSNVRENFSVRNKHLKEKKEGIAEASPLGDGFKSPPYSKGEIRSNFARFERRKAENQLQMVNDFRLFLRV